MFLKFSAAMRTHGISRIAGWNGLFGKKSQIPMDIEDDLGKVTRINFE
jgi:hypothetical protein